MTKTYWITDSRFKWISLLLVLIFLILMAVIVWQGENISKNACQICAKQMGEDVICTLGGYNSIQRIYHPDYSIENKGG